MTNSHAGSLRKKSGGRTRRLRKPTKAQKAGQFAEPEYGERKTESRRIRGGSHKTVVKRAEQVNVAVDGEVKRADIESVEENEANPNFVRRSLLTKGTVVQTSEGKARITSRPGQQGVINAKHIE